MTPDNPELQPLNGLWLPSYDSPSSNQHMPTHNPTQQSVIPSNSTNNPPGHGRTSSVLSTNNKGSNIEAKTNNPGC